MSHILTFATKSEMTKVFFQGKWWKAGGGNYNKEEFLLNRIFGSYDKTYLIESFSVAGWRFSTVEVAE